MIFRWRFTDLINLGFPLSECKLVQGLQCVDFGYLFESPGLLVGHVGGLYRGLYRGLGDCGYTSSRDKISHQSVEWKHHCDITRMSELTWQLFFFVVCVLCTICTVIAMLYKNRLLPGKITYFCVFCSVLPMPVMPAVLCCALLSLKELVFWF